MTESVDVNLAGSVASKDSESFRAGPAGVDDQIPVDAATLKFLMARLSLEDIGRLSVQISRAALAKRPSQLQRLLLAIVCHRGDAS